MKEIDFMKKSELPQVIVDKELAVIIEQWIDYFPFSETMETPVFSLLIPLRASSLVKLGIVTPKGFDVIKQKIGYLLTCIGISKEETCELTNFDLENTSFQLMLKEANKVMNVQLTWRGFSSSGAQMIIQDEDKKRVYDYHPSFQEIPMHLTLQEYVYQDKEHQSTYTRMFSSVSFSCRVKCRDDSLSLYLVKPYSDLNKKPFTLNHEKELEQYLCGLTFPVSIDQVYQKIESLTFSQVEEYPKMHLEVQKKEKDQEKVTDFISLEYGKMDKVMMTKEGKSVILDHKDNWFYQKDGISIRSTEEEIDYQFHQKKRKKYYHLKIVLRMPMKKWKG